MNGSQFLQAGGIIRSRMRQLKLRCALLFPGASNAGGMEFGKSTLRGLLLRFQLVRGRRTSGPVAVSISRSGFLIEFVAQTLDETDQLLRIHLVRRHLREFAPVIGTRRFKRIFFSVELGHRVFFPWYKGGKYRGTAQYRATDSVFSMRVAKLAHFGA